MIDYLKCKAPISVFNRYNLDYWRKNLSEIEEIDVQDYLAGNHKKRISYISNGRDFDKQLGHSGAWVRYSESESEYITIDFSPKILKEKYLQGLTENTLVQGIHHINKIAGSKYEINTNKFIDKAMVIKADNTIDFPVEENEIINILNSFKDSVTWNRKKWKGDKEHITTIYLTNGQEKLRIYSKLNDLKENKLSKPYLKYCNENQNLIRFEVVSENKEKTLSRYKKILGPEIMQVNLSDIIYRNVSNRMIKNVKNELKISKNDLSNLPKSDIYNMIKEIGIQKSIDFVGIESVMKEYNNNLSIVESAIKEHYDDMKASRSSRNEMIKKFRGQVDAYKSIGRKYLTKSSQEIVKDSFNRMDKIMGLAV